MNIVENILPEYEQEVLCYYNNTWRRGYCYLRNNKVEWYIESNKVVNSPSHWQSMPNSPVEYQSDYSNLAI